MILQVYAVNDEEKASRTLETLPKGGTRCYPYLPTHGQQRWLAYNHRATLSPTLPQEVDGLRMDNK
jgi:hypothetical protein